MRALVLLALIGSASAATAQDAGAELVEALFATLGAGSGDLEVRAVLDAPPEGAEVRLLPEAAVVLGGVTLSADDDQVRRSITVVFARLGADPEAAADRFVADLAGDWRAIPRDRLAGRVDLCGPGGQMVEVQFVPRRAGGTYLSVSDEGDSCPPDVPEVEAADVEVDVIGDGEIIDEPGELMIADPIEAITLPDAFPNAAFADRSADSFAFSREGVRGNYRRVEVKEGTSVEAVAGLAADAFEADGWTRLGDAATGEALVSTWTRTEAAEFDDQPDLVTFATVVVQPTGEGTVEVLVTATR